MVRIQPVSGKNNFNIIGKTEQMHLLKTVPGRFKAALGVSVDDFGKILTPKLVSDISKSFASPLDGSTYHEYCLKRVLDDKKGKQGYDFKINTWSNSRELIVKYFKPVLKLFSSFGQAELNFIRSIKIKNNYLACVIPKELSVKLTLFPEGKTADFELEILIFNSRVIELFKDHAQKAEIEKKSANLRILESDDNKELRLSIVKGLNIDPDKQIISVVRSLILRENDTDVAYEMLGILCKGLTREFVDRSIIEKLLDRYSKGNTASLRLFRRTHEILKIKTDPLEEILVSLEEFDVDGALTALNNYISNESRFIKINQNADRCSLVQSILKKLKDFKNCEKIKTALKPFIERDGVDPLLYDMACELTGILPSASKKISDHLKRNEYEEASRIIQTSIEDGSETEKSIFDYFTCNLLTNIEKITKMIRLIEKGCFSSGLNNAILGNIFDIFGGLDIKKMPNLYEEIMSLKKLVKLDDADRPDSKNNALFVTFIYSQLLRYRLDCIECFKAKEQGDNILYFDLTARRIVRMGNIFNWLCEATKHVFSKKLPTAKNLTEERIEKLMGNIMIPIETAWKDAGLLLGLLDFEKEISEEDVVNEIHKAAGMAAFMLAEWMKLNPHLYEGFPKFAVVKTEVREIGLPRPSGIINRLLEKIKKIFWKG